MVGVGILMKCMKVIGSQPIINKQGQTCKGSKKVTSIYIYVDKNSNHKIINISIILGEQQIRITSTVILGIMW